jgi:ribosomal-protein-serine acetyltransferase
VGALDEAIQETLPDLVRWLPWARPNHTRQDTRLYLRGARLARSKRRAFEFLVEDIQSGAVLGITSLHRIDWARRCAGLGYWIRRSAWGKGAATEATDAVIEYAFHDLALNRLEVHVAPENLASLRVAEKLGFQREGIAREAELINGQYSDHVQYSLLRSDLSELPGGAP